MHDKMGNKQHEWNSFYIGKNELETTTYRVVTQIGETLEYEAEAHDIFILHEINAMQHSPLIS